MTINLASRTIAACSRRLFAPTGAIALALCSLTAQLLMLDHAPAQADYRPASTFFSQDYQAEIGKTVVSPAGTPAGLVGRAGVELSSCQASCDAFLPRQPVLVVEWENEAAGTEPTPSRSGPETRIRLDISGTASGFAEGNYGTIRLSNIPAVDEVVLDPASPIPAAGGEVLLNRVEANRIVERPSQVPIFDSPDVMNRLMSELPQDVRAAVEADKQTGALGQVRVLGRASTPISGVSQQIVTMVGIQPGATYRLRLVEEQARGAETIFEQICRIPVCPADFVNPGQ
jgi:hypothetical protein